MPTATRRNTKPKEPKRVLCKLCLTGLTVDEAHQIKPKTGRLYYVCPNCVKLGWGTPIATESLTSGK